MHSKILLSVCLSIGIFTGLAKANSLYLTQTPPDIYSDYLQVNYTASTQSFAASGYSFTFDLDGKAAHLYDIYDASNYSGGGYDILAKIDHQGHALSGTLSVTGYIPSLLGASGTGTLLTGTLSQFGYPNAGGDPMEFVFTNLGGDLAHYYGKQADVIMDYTGFAGTFTQNFGNYGLGQADTCVPEPMTCVTLLGAAAGLVGYIRRRRNAAA